MAETATPEIGRKEHDRIIKNRTELDGRLFAPLTLASISVIECKLQELREQTGCEYVAVPIGQPYGGPKRPVALPREDVDAVHRAYQNGLRGVSPEIGRAYDLQAERERLENNRPVFNSDYYPPEFLKFLRYCFNK